MQVVADVDEADIAGIKDSARVTFTVDAYPDDVFEGKVYQIRLGSVETAAVQAAPAQAAKQLSLPEVVISLPTTPDWKAEYPNCYCQHRTIYTDTRDNQ